MAKKKLRYKKRKKKHNGPQTPYDTHHLLFIRREWSEQPYDGLRTHPYCLVKIPRETLHHYIHSHLAYIPVPRPFSIEFVLIHLKYLEEHGALEPDDGIEKRLKILIALFDCMEPATARALKKQIKLVHEFNKKTPP